MFQSFDAPQPATATAPRVADLRALMAKLGIDALLIPRADEHQNEYVPPSAERLAWITGFTGSAGLAVIAAKSAAVFVDGRYTVQAPNEVDTKIFDVKAIRGTDLLPWLTQNLPNDAVIGFDPKLHTIAEMGATQRSSCRQGLVAETRFQKSNLPRVGQNSPSRTVRPRRRPAGRTRRSRRRR